MDFDEYEYLEKTVEQSNNKQSSPAPGNANGKGTPPREDKEKNKERRSGSKHKGDDDSDRDRDRDRHRSKRSRHRDDDDDSRDRHRDRDKERERERDRERERERSSSRHRSGDRDRDQDRDREDREKDRDRERERERRSRSRSERRYVEDEYRRHREKSRERELRERELKERERRKKEEAEPEVDPERDQRTVFAYQLSLKADERDVYEFFSRAGKVRDVRLIMDRNSRRSKGVGYIEFYDVMSVPMAIALSGQPLLGLPVMVKPSEAEKNLVQSNTTAGGAAGAGGQYSGGARRLYVGNIPYNITEDLLRQVFDPFGTIELVQLPIDPETGHGKGFGFIQFARLEDAKAALSLNGQIAIAGKTIKVSTVTEQGGAQDVKGNTGDLDDDEGGGLSLDAHSRALLMQKLARSSTTTSVAGVLPTPTASALTVPTPVLGITPVANPLLQPSLAPALAIPGSVLSTVSVLSQSLETGVPTECLLLKNMFDPSIETEPDFDLDIKEDVQEECSKFGTIKHIFVDKNSAGFVYLKFDSATSASNAQCALHGRWFAGKMITATFMLPQQYNAKFPDSI